MSLPSRAVDRCGRDRDQLRNSSPADWPQSSCRPSHCVTPDDLARCPSDRRTGGSTLRPRGISRSARRTSGSTAIRPVRPFAAIATCLFAATSRSTSVGGGQLESGSADERAHRLQVPARSSGTLARHRSLTPLEWPHPDLAIAGLRRISGELERDIQRGDRDDLEDAACFSPPADLSHMLQVVAVS
jgi:hypothetical protein